MVLRERESHNMGMIGGRRRERKYEIMSEMEIEESAEKEGN